MGLRYRQEAQERKTVKLPGRIAVLPTEPVSPAFS